MSKKRIIGLMGNSGSGKSTVAACLQELGADVIDADRISREVCEPGQKGNRQVRQAFGDSFFHGDGSLDRHKLGELVFAQPDQRRRLEGIVHPLVLEEMRHRLDTTNEDTVVIDCALLVDTGLHELADEVWLVRAPGSEKLDRICRRDGIGRGHAQNRLGSQLNEEQLEQYADHVIRNDGSLDELYRQVRELYGQGKQ